METNENGAWVAEKLAALQPEWEPRPGRAQAMLRERLVEAPRARRLVLALAASAGLAAFVLALPEGRLKAQELWNRFVVRDFAVVRLDLSKAPFQASIQTNGMTRTVQNLEEAAQYAGFAPALPAGFEAGLTVVTGPISVSQIVDLPKLRSALQASGAMDLRVPDEWEGAAIRMELGPLVITEIKGDSQVIQARPFELRVPPGFRLAQFSEAVFRSLGVPAWQASLMGNKFARNPAWLLDIPEDEAVNVEEVRIGESGGLLVEDPTEEAASRVTILFNTKDRIFAVSSPSRARSLQLARELEFKP